MTSPPDASTTEDWGDRYLFCPFFCVCIVYISLCTLHCNDAACTGTALYSESPKRGTARPCALTPEPDPKMAKCPNDAHETNIR